MINTLSKCDLSIVRGRMVAAFLSSGVLTGCVIADDYAVRATTYNAEAAETRSNTTLLNILRAANRKPLQFTDISTVTGTANASGSLASSVPFLGNGGTISPTVSLSGGPSFGVANLNTQEFFQGIQTPISKAQIAAMLEQGVRPDVLFPLVISSIVIDDGSKRILVKTDIDSYRQFAYPYSLVRQLASAGLSLEPVKSEIEVGPTLTLSEAKSMLPTVIRASAEAVKGNKVPSLTTSKKAFVFKKNDSDLRFCFDPNRSSRAESVYPDSNLLVSKSGALLNLRLAYGAEGPSPLFTIPVPDSYRCGQGGKTKGKISLSLNLRSLEGMYRYLGGMARLELGLDGREPISLAIGTPAESYYFFDIKRGSPFAGDLSATYVGQTYYVRADASGRDASSEVLQILSDLMALQSKASDFPSPSTVAVLNR